MQNVYIFDFFQESILFSKPKQIRQPTLEFGFTYLEIPLKETRYLEADIEPMKQDSLMRG